MEAADGHQQIASWVGLGDCRMGLVQEIHGGKLGHVLRMVLVCGRDVVKISIAIQSPAKVPEYFTRRVFRFAQFLDLPRCQQGTPYPHQT